jgi:hypothetical protein
MNEKILIVDDNPQICSLLERYLIKKYTRNIPDRRHYRRGSSRKGRADCKLVIYVKIQR